MPKTKLNEETLQQNFADYHPPYTRNEAIAEASRCLFCYDAPCTRACPTHIDVPKFIRQIMNDNPLGSAETIFAENIFGGSCARACPVEVLCEGACVDNTLLDDPVKIGRLQRYATDYAAEKNIQFFEPGADTGKKVAAIGAGPASLSCANELRKAGHNVDVFESRDVPGGLNTLGIAPYKISTEFALSEVEPIKNMGVKIHLNSPVNAEKLASLLNKYDAVFLGIGLGPTLNLNITGENIPGVWEALDFIFQTHTGSFSECVVGETVVVVGGGNTAVDAASQAVRLGAKKVIMAYRRTQADMPAYNYEYEIAINEGIQFEWLVSPIEFIETDGKLSGVKFQRLKPEGTGRKAKLTPIESSEFIIECDMAVKALGQAPLSDFLTQIDGLKFENGKVIIDPETGATSIRGLYAGGDCISKGAEIVNAVQEGKIAAHAINIFLSNQK
jgi:dihydropyrimidine dehydrogenase (NAD+) subunit PreT